MINGNIGVSTVNDRTKDFLEALKSLSKVDVLVGVPEEQGSREGDTITNAELAFIHTNGARALPMRKEMNKYMDEGANYSKAQEMYIQAHGSPLWQSPPRPIIEPAIEDPENKEIISTELKKAAESALSGDTVAMSRGLVRAGMQAQNIVRDWFTNPKNNWQPNSPFTIEQKGSDRPLIDTGELRKSITYVIREK